MAFRNPSNQLIQIDTGSARTYLFNQSQSPISVYANIGETQVPGQRYFAAGNVTAANPYGSPAIYVLANYLSTSAITTANLTTAAAPAPVYWTDNTFTTVTGVASEGFNSIQAVAGYMMVNTTSLPSLTSTLLKGALVLVQVAGYLKGAYGPASGGGALNWIIGAAGALQSAGVTAGTAPGYRTLGVQLTAISSGLCDVLVNSDII